MGIHNQHWKVAVALALLAGALSLVSARRGSERGSHSGHFPCNAASFWNETSQECVKCKVCEDVTLRPCESHRDALCGSVADLNIDWSWIRKPKAAAAAPKATRPPATRPPKAERHYVELPKSWQETIREHDPQHHILRQTDDDQVLHEDELGRKSQNFGDDYILPKELNKKKKGHHNHHHHKTTTTTASPDDYDYDDDYLDDPSPKPSPTASTTAKPSTSSTTEEPSTSKKPLRLVYKVPYRDVFYDYTVGHDADPDPDADEDHPERRRLPPPEEPFSSVETLVWDWQAVVLISAIATCVLFLVVIVIYTCYYAQQWRKIKKTFDSDMEELSLRLNLINGMGLEHLHDPSAPPAKTLHLAHLIAQKQQEAVVNAALPGTIRPNMNLYSTATSIKKNNT